MQYEDWFDTAENKTLLAVCTRKWIKNIGFGGIIWGLIIIVLGVTGRPLCNERPI